MLPVKCFKFKFQIYFTDDESAIKPKIEILSDVKLVENFGTLCRVNIRTGAEEGRNDDNHENDLTDYRRSEDEQHSSQEISVRAPYNSDAHYIVEPITSSAAECTYVVQYETDGYTPEFAEKNIDEYANFQSDENLKRVIEAIHQLEKDNEPDKQTVSSMYVQLDDVTQSGDISTTEDFQMDIQAQVNVKTTEPDDDDPCENDIGLLIKVEDELEIPLPAKRCRKTKPELELFLKSCVDGRKRTPVKKTPEQSTPSKGADYIIHIEVEPESSNEIVQSVDLIGKHLFQLIIVYMLVTNSYLTYTQINSKNKKKLKYFYNKN